MDITRLSGNYCADFKKNKKRHPFEMPLGVGIKNEPLVRKTFTY
jgi:hypothetical protein